MPKNPIAPAIGRREALRLAASGRDGGTMRSAVRGDADHNAILRLVGNMGLTRWAPDFAKAIPNVAESWTTNQDASDDLLPDTAFYAAPPPQYVINSKLMRGEKMDDYTVRLIFAGPYLTFPERLAGPLGQHPVCRALLQPVHAQIQSGHRQAAGRDAAARLGDAVPPALRRHRNPARRANPARPVLHPWVVSTPYTGGAMEVVLTRNPYFWQADPAGNQLPYAGAAGRGAGG